MDENTVKDTKNLLFSWYDYLEKWLETKDIGYISDNNFRITEYGEILAIIKISIWNSFEDVVIYDGLKYPNDTPENRDKLIKLLTDSFPSIEINELYVEKCPSNDNKFYIDSLRISMSIEDLPCYNP